MCSIESIFNFIKSGASEIISEDELRLLILKKKLVIKVGFDPTTSDLHLGHVVILKKLRQFQNLGYCICFLIGDFTAMIGDPSGRSKSRKSLSKEDVMCNYKTYSEQIFRILDPLLTKIYFNSIWFNFFGINNLLDLISSTTLSRLLERNDFKVRYESNKPISINEIIYPFLQGYDSVFLESDIEVGGIDQKFNFLLSRDLQKKHNQKPQVSIMMPILLGIDGKNKMSKSLGNCINLSDDPYDVFCKVMSIPDFLMQDYFIHLSFLSKSEYFDMLNSYDNPMTLKIKLAVNIVSLLYNELLAEKSRVRFNDYFSKGLLSDDIEKLFLYVKSDKLLLFDILCEIKFLSTRSDFKRLLKFNSIRVDGIVVNDRCFYLNINNFYFLQVGKKKVVKIYLKKI